MIQTMSNENNFKIGPKTANLLMALRAVEAARENYYLAIVNEDEHPLSESEEAAFDAAGSLIEKAICDNVRFWATSTNPGELI